MDGGGAGALLLAAAIGYLSGSIPFGLLLTRWAGLGDVRKLGSGNIGATNVLRTGSKAVAAFTLLCDILKGAIPAALATAWLGETAGLAAGLGAFFGHVFPVWLGFKGGKGVATGLGVLLGLAWPMGLGAMAVWLAVAILFRKSSLAALTACVLVTIAAALTLSPVLAAGIALMSTVIVLAHRANIGRLMRGEEPPISFGSKPAP